MSLLIQIFCGDQNIQNIQNVLDVLKQKLPKAQVIGSSTTGEIDAGEIYEKTITICFCMFNDTKLRVLHYDKSDYQTGKNVAQNFLNSKTKVIIAFSEALKQDSQCFLDGFNSISRHVVLAGGNAGDNYQFKQTFIISGDKIHFEGIVVCALDNDNLQVHVDYSLEWKTIGSEMLITKADTNTIYEIDYMPIEDIYRFYLGDEILDNFPASAIEFPLIKVENGVNIARSIVAKNENNGYMYAGHFKNGDKVKFAIGNIEDVLSKSANLHNNIISSPVEAIFIYSCSVRKMFIGEQLNYEFGLIEQIAPTAGFFTYGEFYHSGVKNQLLNITTTTLSLSESDKILKKDILLPNKLSRTMLNSLVNLVSKSDTKLLQYKELLDISSIVSKTDINGYITYANEKFCKVSGYTREELIGKRHSIVKHPDTDKAIYRDMWKKIANKKIWKGTIKNRAKNGSDYYIKSIIMPILDENGKIIEFMSSRTDVTELVKKDEIIKQQYKDGLTGLQNRSSLYYSLSDNVDEKASLILINIDRFSDINDYFGFEQGDLILKEFAKNIGNQRNNIFRISGDEFAILCEHSLDTQARNSIIEMIVDLQSIEYTVLQDNMSLYLSCGVAYGRKDEIYKQAHIALKESKISKQEIVFYNDNEDLTKQIEDNIKIISNIKQGIKEDRFVPYFQGILDNKTKKITKYECLIRLKEENSNVISPFFFLEHAKKAKLYTKLTKIMISKSFAKFADTQYEFSINLSAQDILSNKVVNFLFRYLKKYKCGSRVVLEIVESEGFENFDELLVFIKQVKKYGCRIAIDDFGTGYSNFHYLSKLNIDFLKIDGSLIKNLNKDKVQLASVESILHFAKKMDIKTIAEFVEDEEVFETLCDLGVDFSQGYLFSKPSEELVK
ncbi:MAG: EAL domain-containing protein [Campylobacteraceae bacterium]|nr:EAL domain-containing protein [Campylobacteraceae bacterium]